MVDLRCIVSGYQSEWRRDGYMNCCAPKGKLMDTQQYIQICMNLFNQLSAVQKLLGVEKCVCVCKVGRTLGIEG